MSAETFRRFAAWSRLQAKSLRPEGTKAFRLASETSAN